jgi:predicted nucleotidyltransferase component of viral defense system
LVKSTLDSFQEEILRKFFSRESGYFLSGGGALAGFYLGHRKTEDLDLFTLNDEIQRGFEILREVGVELGATIEPLQTSPDFRRVLVSRDDDAVVIDLVREYVYQVDGQKRIVNGIRVDTAEEIFANKLAALLSRSEIRDLVDIYELEKAGYAFEPALWAAAKKDTGLSAAQLAWVLSNIRLSDSAEIPGNVPVEEIRQFLSEIVIRLQKSAVPKAE